MDGDLIAGASSMEALMILVRRLLEDQGAHLRLMEEGRYRVLNSQGPVPRVRVVRTEGRFRFERGEP